MVGTSSVPRVSYRHVLCRQPPLGFYGTAHQIPEHPSDALRVRTWYGGAETMISRAEGFRDSATRVRCCRQLFSLGETWRNCRSLVQDQGTSAAVIISSIVTVHQTDTWCRLPIRDALVHDSLMREAVSPYVSGLREHFAA
jgi:hypothetical protein